MVSGMGPAAESGKGQQSCQSVEFGTFGHLHGRQGSIVRCGSLMVDMLCTFDWTEGKPVSLFYSPFSRSLKRYGGWQADRIGISRRGCKGHFKGSGQGAQDGHICR